MKVEISIDCIDDTGRIPKSQVIIWEIKSEDGDLSRDARMRTCASVILKTLRSHYPSYLKRQRTKG